MLANIRRPKPYIYSPQEIEQLLEATSRLRPKSTHFVRIPTKQSSDMIASTGLRAGEALRLTVNDVRLDADFPHLEVLRTKFRKSRLVPSHSTTTDKLRLYAAERKRLHYDGLTNAFFPSEQGGFSRLRFCMEDIRYPYENRLESDDDESHQRPCSHGLRTTFAGGAHA